MITAVSGLALVGAGSAFAYLDSPDTTVTVAAQEAGGDGVSDARSTLQQASLPLSVLGGGVGQLTDGSRQLDDGAKQLADGLGQARAGGEQLAGGLDQLQGGVGLLGDGASQVSGGVDEVVTRLTGFGEMQGSVTAQLTTVADTLDLAGDPVSRSASGKIRELVGMLNTQGLGPDTMDQLALLRGGAQQLAYELTDPNAQFVAGMSQAADGSQQLLDGLVMLDDGGRQLTDGTGQLVAGVGPVSNVVESISGNVREATEALPKGTAQAAEPTVATADRQWWPFALIAGGAVLLLVPVFAPRSAVTPTRSDETV
jgi:X-X-X-Leu-X-X-Gly heptad repeat protein